jgi:hypothetical protein
VGGRDETAFEEVCRLDLVAEERAERVLRILGRMIDDPPTMRAMAEFSDRIVGDRPAPR